jgi:hypothetical protein
MAVPARPCRPPRTAAELADAAGRAGADSRWTAGEVLTPPLPRRWPGAAQGGLVFFTYKFAPMPTSRVTSRVRGPFRRIEFATLDAQPVVQPLKSDTLGYVDDSAASDDDAPARLAAATDALVEIVAGCRPEGEARTALAPYQSWLREHDPIARDLERRLPAFIAWLREGQ